MRDIRIAVYIGAILTFLGCIVCTLGVVVAVTEARSRRRGRTAQARVIENEVRVVGRRRNHFPVFEFRTDDGKVIRVRSAYGSGKAVHQIGDEVSVRYEPFDPVRAEILGEGRAFVVAINLFGIVLASIGIACITFGR